VRGSIRATTIFWDSERRQGVILGPSNHSPAGAMIGPMTSTVALVGVLLRLAASLYSSVVPSGASGGGAVMVICGVSVMVMRPTALTVNVLVASITTARVRRAGCCPRGHS
jgi:hypothetical protein